MTQKKVMERRRLGAKVRRLERALEDVGRMAADYYEELTRSYGAAEDDEQVRMAKAILNRVNRSL